MTLFSQRKGIKPLSKAIQRESADKELRNRLWSALKIFVWDKWSASNFYTQKVNQILDMIWLHYFVWPLDERPELQSNYQSKTAYDILREYFYRCKWNEVYDFIEFVAKEIDKIRNEWANEFKLVCNDFLMRESTAYRFVGVEIVEITDQTEIQSIEDAMTVTIRSISTHIQRGIELLSDKKKPDYRNSIKESISAVEACCHCITGDEKATLGQALKKIGQATAIHPALEKGFSSIYGYTSDSGGIRHALADGDVPPSYADAKFMMVACSSFINFLMTKSAESGMKID